MIEELVTPDDEVRDKAGVAVGVAVAAGQAVAARV
jgi:hypothetical protein